MRILIADDHPLFRDGVMSLLEAGGHEIVGFAANGADTVKKALEIIPDLVLLDIHMPVMSGLEALSEIKAKQPSIHVVILTVSEDDEDIKKAVHAGADGYILKHIDSPDFLSLLNNLKSGNAVISPAIATRLFRQTKQMDSRHPRIDLSARELEILKLVAAGKSNHDIAGSINISENTVKYHLKNIMHKLSVSNRTEAVTFALQEGML